jgi:phosphoribosylformimino-5-aminoimidazole carboxamide ribotide isomerase
MIIYPAIDILGGQCVRLTKGDFNTKKIYFNDPVARAKQFEDEGYNHIHIVDLDAARGEQNNLSIIEKIATSTKLNIQMGGGIRTTELLNQVFDYGVQKAVIGSIAVRQPTLVYEWIEICGSDKIVIGADVVYEHITIDGWHHTSDHNIIDFVKNYMQHGAMQFLCTDVSKDGMMQGIAMDLYKKVKEACPNAKIIASGGVSNIDDVFMAKENGLHAIVIGKAIYENKIRTQELIEHNYLTNAY